jgi:hypothetical protein
VNFLLSIYNWLRKTITLPSAFSWQTLIVLSVFSFYMSILADNFVKDLLVNFAWIFLILGVFWGSTACSQLRIGYRTPAEPGFPLSPWITGALVSIYIFGVLLGNDTGAMSQEMLVSWPIISAIIAILPDYLGAGGFKVKVPAPEKRQQQVLLVGSQILLSCWFQFHFVIQDYLAQYPSLRVDDFRKSAFVVKWEGPLYTETPRGADILNTMENDLQKQLDSRSWPEVERLLLEDERKKLIATTQQQAKERLLSVEEDGLWDITSKVSSRGSGYNIELQAIWRGPRSRDQPYVITKTCQITPISPRASEATKPINAQPTTSPTAVSRFECQPLKGWGVQQPILASE